LIQSLLFFVLGVLACGFVVALFAPAALRRSARLTRRRIEATIPLKKEEIEAERDGVRAQYAIETRKLEMELKTLRDKAAGQAIDIIRYQEAVRLIEEKCAQGEAALAESEARNSALRSELGQRESRFQQLAQSLASAEKTIEAHAAEMDKLGQMYDEASFSSSNRQIELVARESELEQIRGDISALRAGRKEADRLRKEAEAETRSAREALRAERKKTVDLDKKLERLMATLADREDKIERRERELTRLRGERKAAPRASSGAAASGDAAMRETMQDLAARVTDMVIRLEGPGSPAAKALQAATPASGTAAGPISLADRIKALQKSS
jgi:chromosome segregation ATPase